VLKGERITMRPLDAADVPALATLFAHPEVAHWWPGENRARLEARLTEDDGIVAMVVELDGRLIGFIQYYEEPDPDYRHAGIDIALHPDWCGQGLGTEAVRTLARHLFDDRGHHRIQIDPTVSNERAIRSYRKVGFSDVGVMHRYERANDGTWRDSLLMELFPEDLA
jgi:aminoglycoside 6'-N-acetyltransferase